MEDELKILEDCAQVLLASPYEVSCDQRRQAESVFLNFRKTKSPFVLCIKILENSKVEYVLFQSVALLKDSIIREWSTIPRPEIESLRNYLMCYVSNRTSLSLCVKEQIFQVLAIIVKKSGVDGITIDKEYLLNEVSRLIGSGNVFMQMSGCSILTALLNEYANSVKTSDIALTWENHYETKKAFEKVDLKRIFQFCLQVLNELEKCTEPSRDYFLLLSKILTIAEQVMNWNFISRVFTKKVVGILEADLSPSLNPGIGWRDIYLESAVLDLFFKIHWKIRTNEEIIHNSFNCLSQLASLNGSIFPNDDARISYLSQYLQGLLKLMTSDLKGIESLGVSSIICKLIISFPPPVLILAPRQQVEAFINSMANVTCKFAHESLMEQMAQNSRNYFSEAFESILENWELILQDAHMFLGDLCQNAAVQILKTFLQCHLSSADGIKNQLADINSVEEIDELEENDRERFKDQLLAIGQMGRLSLEHIIPFLCTLIEERVKLMYNFIGNAHHPIPNATDTQQLYRLYDDLHWLILISGHILANVVNEDERSQIPIEVMKYSFNCRSSITVDATIRVLVSDVSLLDQNSYQHCDPIIRLIASIFHLAEICRQALKTKLVDLLSPEIASTLMWFLRHWALSYLLLDETLYPEISPTISAVFGQDSQSSNWCLNFLLDQIDSNISAWTSENQVVIDTVSLFVTVVDHKERGKNVAKCDGFWNVIRNQVTNNVRTIHATAQRDLLKAVVIAGSAATEMASVEQYCLEILKPLLGKFKSIISQEKFSSIYHEENVQKEIIHLLDCFIGIVRACNMRNAQLIFSFMHPVINELIPIMNLYHNYPIIVTEIIECFCECAKVMLSYVSLQDSRLLYQAFLQMIQTYAKANVGKKSSQAFAEEEQHQDLILVMELLTNVMSKDFFECNSPDDPAGVISSADVTLYGLNIIMPLMNAELLKFPNLCEKYYKMITFVCEIYPEKVSHLPEQLFKQLLSSLELGFTSFGSNIIMLCLDFLSVLVTHILKKNMKDHMIYDGIKPFLKIVFELALLQIVDASVLQSSSTCLFVLICCYQDYFKELAQDLISKQTDESSHNRLCTAFNKLMEDVQFVDARPNKIKFRDNFEKFIAEVKGFLCLK